MSNGNENGVIHQNHFLTKGRSSQLKMLLAKRARKTLRRAFRRTRARARKSMRHRK